MLKETPRERQLNGREKFEALMLVAFAKIAPKVQFPIVFDVLRELQEVLKYKIKLKHLFIFN